MARTLSPASTPLPDLANLYCKNPPCPLAYMTFSTTCSSNLNTLAKTARDMNMDFALLGLDSFWYGWGGRMRYYARYVETLPPDTIVIASDASDILLLPCNAQDIMDEFKALDTPILFTGEKACWPDHNVKSQYPLALNNSPYKYLNAGLFIGYAWALRLLFETAYTCDCSDDQRAFTDIFLKECSYTLNSSEVKSIVCREKLNEIHTAPVAYGKEFEKLSLFNLSHGQGGIGNIPLGTRFPLIKLDYTNRIFQSLYDTSFDDFDFDYDGTQPKLTSRITQGRPCIFHQNGPKSNNTVWIRIADTMISAM